MKDSIEVDTVESEREMEPQVTYILDHSLNLKSVRPCDHFKRAHQDLFFSGKLDHNWSDEERSLWKPVRIGPSVARTLAKGNSLAVGSTAEGTKYLRLPKPGGN